MRQSRIKAPAHLAAAYYHCVSRVVDRQFVFGEPEKEEFVRLMRLYEKFCGVRSVTYCVMSNHFHLLVEVPQRPEGFSLSDEELLERLKPVVSTVVLNTVRQRLAMLGAAGDEAVPVYFRYRCLGDMDDDGDDLTAWEETMLGTSDATTDFDGDFLNDYWEAFHGFDPTHQDADGDGTWDTNEDPDQDGLVNFWEQFLVRDPNNPDTDGDDLDDSHEIPTETG